MYDRLYHAAQVSLQKKVMKQREQELIDKARPNSTRVTQARKSEQVVTVQKAEMLDTEFDEDGNQIGGVP